MDLGIDGRAAIVTGGSGGIGAATARALSAEGASVLLIGRNEDALRRVADECNGAVATLAIDITRPEAGAVAVDKCLEAFGRVDVLVNGAGMSRVRGIEEVPDEEWQEQWELHVIAPMRLMRAAIPRMVQGGWGRIVNVSSSSGKRPSSNFGPAYSVTKAAQLSLSRAYADAYASRGVLINAVAPGPVAGELWLAAGGLADQQAQARGITREEVIEATGARVPVGRMATEAEIAGVIVFLCSDAAGYVAGAAWSVDGGTVQIII